MDDASMEPTKDVAKASKDVPKSGGQCPQWFILVNSFFKKIYFILAGWKCPLFCALP